MVLRSETECEDMKRDTNHPSRVARNTSEKKNSKSLQFANFHNHLATSVSIAKNSRNLSQQQRVSVKLDNFDVLALTHNKQNNYKHIAPSTPMTPITHRLTYGSLTTTLREGGGLQHRPSTSSLFHN